MAKSSAMIAVSDKAHRQSGRLGIAVLLVIPGSLLLALALFELLYRFQVIDFFSAELRAFNPPAVLADRSGAQTLLVMGDSFTAGTQSYPAVLHRSQGRYRVINASIPGTNVREALAAAPRRFREFQPSLFLYQVYVGNDLYNITYPINWRTVSWTRNVYWSIAQRFRSVWYVNYKNGQIAYWLRERGSPPAANQPGQALWDASCRDLAELRPPRETFMPQAYTLRDRIMLKAEPHIIENQALLREGREKDYAEWLDTLGRLLPYCTGTDCRAYLLVIPHAAQVSAHYREDMQALGAQFDAPQAVGAKDYPFLRRLRAFLLENEFTNVTVLDPMPAFRKSEDTGIPVYYQNDSHLNPYGQVLLGNYVLDAMGLPNQCRGR